MKSPVPRVAAIHDLSGFGRASLTVIIPILSTMGIQVCPLPTAVLSSHTGGFENYRLVDLTGNMEDFMNHWRSMGLRFDAIYSGFLGSSHQIDIVGGFIDSFAEADQLVLVDPVMGDNGKAYGPVNVEQIDGMRRLVKKAHAITPNFTEACFLLDRDYSARIEPRELRDWLVRLSDRGPEIVVITSVPLNPERGASTVMAYNRTDGRFWKVDCTYIPAYYPGTGDAFASVILGSLLQGDSLPIALDRAVQFTTLAVKASFGYDLPRREGVLLERVLGHLKAPLASITYEIVEW
ncbi:MAG TPA: pyridoxamine kinase [Desulfobacteraceae bacterium]|nr:pyridoxamine kinase [Desulfobacteraceae bacterium]